MRACAWSMAGPEPVRGLGDEGAIRTERSWSSPRSPNQAAYLRALDSHDLVFALGPAGTGKTYLAVAMAVALLKQRRIERIILSRPAVEAGERLGFLPGDLKDKVDPYMRPLYDALQDMLPEGKLQQRIDAGPDRDRPARLHARPHAEQRLRHPGRGAEHHALADEDVPDPHGRELPYDRHRRSDADRSAAGHAVRARRRGAQAGWARRR